MGVAILAICAFLGGAACVFFIYQTQRALLNNQERRVNEQLAELNVRFQQLEVAIHTHNEACKAHESEVARSTASLNNSRQLQAIEISRAQLALSEAKQKLSDRAKELQSKHESEVASSIALLNSRGQLQASENAKAQQAIKEAKGRLLERAAELQARIDQFNKQHVTYDELMNENRILKTDIRNISVNAAKQDYQNQDLGRKQQLIDAKSNVLGRRYLNETLKWIDDALSPNNFSVSKQRLLDAIAWCREIGVEITKNHEAEMISNLKQDYERVVRLSFEREEQARIRAQIREEQQHEREVQRAIDEAEREKKAVEAALAKLRAEADGKHTEEIQKLEAELAEAIANSQRAISQAQLTKAGNVYIISNIGTLGQDIYKIGMTRRLDPQERVRELGGASVPFPYDVHMMIATNDAPGLENAFHRAFHKMRVNKANPRKEFFKVTLDQIVKVAEKEHEVVEYKADPEALQYWQSINMKEEDQEFIEQVFDKVEATQSPFAEED